MRYLMILVLASCAAPKDTPMKTNPDTTLTTLTWVQNPRSYDRAQREALEVSGVHLVRRLEGTQAGALVGENPHPVPQRMEVLRGSRVALTQYLRRLRLDPGVERQVHLMGAPVDRTEFHPESDAPVQTRLYGVSLIQFHPGGAEALLAYTRKASGLLQRHGLHVEAMFDVDESVAARGDALPAQDRVMVFYLDTPESFRAYLADPEYEELSAERERGFKAYDFFFARPLR